MALSDQVFSLLFLDRFPSFLLSCCAPLLPGLLLCVDCASGSLSWALASDPHSQTTHLSFYRPARWVLTGFLNPLFPTSHLTAPWAFSDLSHNKKMQSIYGRKRNRQIPAVRLQVGQRSSKSQRPNSVWSEGSGANPTSSPEHSAVTWDPV